MMTICMLAGNYGDNLQDVVDYGGFCMMSGNHGDHLHYVR